MKKVILFCFILLSTQASIACDCFIIKSFYYYYNTSDGVFTGKVLNIKDTTLFEDYHQKVVTLKILDRYKGNFLSDTMIFYTATSSPACGLAIQTGDLWILFSSGNGISKCEPNYLLERNGTSKNEFYLDDYYKGINLKDELNKISNKLAYEVMEQDTVKKMTVQGWIKNGLAAGLWQYEYHTYKGLTREDFFYRNGMQYGPICYYLNGKLEREECWFDGQSTVHEKTYFRNGHLKSERKEDKEGNRIYARYYKDSSPLYYGLSIKGKDIFEMTCFENETTNDHLYYDDDEVLIRIIKGGGEEKEIEITNEHGDRERIIKREDKYLKIEGK